MANAVTLSRLAMIPLVFYLIVYGNNLVAAAVFGIAAITDLIDGYVARKLGTVSEFGKVIDPLTDRIFIFFTVVAIFIRFDVPPLWALIVMVGRDVALLIGYYLVKNEGKKIEVIFVGKLATAILMISFSLIILRFGPAMIFFYIGFALYLSAGFIYLQQGKKLVREGRRVL